jgi:hypothetical protein
VVVRVSLAFAAKHWFVLGICVLGIVYAACALSPSSYGLVFHLFGVNNPPLLGVSRGIRSDEYYVLTPLIQIAVLGHFGLTDVISPYHETLKGFWALPIQDWSLVFKPQLWAFWVLPADYAFSVYWAIIIAAMALGYYFLLMQLGTSRTIAALGSLILLTSHFVQVWGSTDGPAFAFAPWPVIAFLLPIKWYWKAPLIFWTACVWVFGLLYPPLLISGAFALGVLILAFRREAVTLRNVLAAALALAATGAVIYFYFGDMIMIMKNTIYPGSRDVSGGGFELDRLVAQIFPYFTTSQLAALRSDTNDCEIAVVSTMLPLLSIFFIKYAPLGQWARANLLTVGLLMVGLAMMLAWMLLPIPASVGRFLLWNEVPASRMAWGVGLLITMTLAVLIARVGCVMTLNRGLGFAATVVAAWAVSKIGFTEIWGQNDATAWGAMSHSWFDLAVLAPIAVAGLLYWLAKRTRNHAGVLIAATAAITGALTFGTFNPLQTTHGMFDLPDTPVLQKLRHSAQSNPHGWLVAKGFYGAAFNGAGIPSINHSLTVPQLAFFRRVFPNMPEDEFVQTFNRYANIVPSTSIAVPFSPSPDVAEVPALAFNLPLAPAATP